MNTCWYSHTFTCQHKCILFTVSEGCAFVFARALKYFHTSKPTAPTISHWIPRQFNVLRLLMHFPALASPRICTGQHWEMHCTAHWSALQNMLCSHALVSTGNFIYIFTPHCSALCSTRQHWEMYCAAMWMHWEAQLSTHWAALQNALETSFTYLHQHWSALGNSLQSTHWSARIAERIGQHCRAHWSALQSALVSTGNLIYIFAPTLANTGALLNHVNKNYIYALASTGQHWAGTHWPALSFHKG